MYNKSYIDEEEEEFMCNICNEKIHQKYINDLQINHIYLKDNELGNPADCYKCSYCNSRLRIRILPKLLHQTINKKESCIVCSMTTQETKIISKYLNIEKHIDLYCQRGDPNCEIGIDISKPIKTPKKYKYFIAIGVFHYILDMKSVLKNISDILDDNGQIIFWDTKGSIKYDKYFEPTIINIFDQENNFKPDKGVYYVDFSYSWLEETLNKLGFDLKCYTLTDCLTNFEDNYFIASKK